MRSSNFSNAYSYKKMGHIKINSCVRKFFLFLFFFKEILKTYDFIIFNLCGAFFQPIYFPLLI